MFLSQICRLPRELMGSIRRFIHRLGCSGKERSSRRVSSNVLLHRTKEVMDDLKVILPIIPWKISSRKLHASSQRAMFAAALGRLTGTSDGRYTSAIRDTTTATAYLSKLKTGILVYRRKFVKARNSCQSTRSSDWFLRASSRVPSMGEVLRALEGLWLLKRSST